MKETEIFLVRHAVTEWNQSGFFQGVSDIPLNADGYEQANLLAERFLSSGQKIDHIYVSSLARTRQTAEPLAAKLGLQIETLEGIQEINGGKLEGGYHYDNVINYPETMEMATISPYHAQFPEGESGKDVYERMVRAFDFVVKTHPGESILLISHGYALQMLQSYIQKLDAENTKRQMAANTAVTHVKVDSEGKFTVSYINDASHLPAKWQVSSENQSTIVYKLLIENPEMKAASDKLAERLELNSISEINWKAFATFVIEDKSRLSMDYVQSLTKEELADLRSLLLNTD